MDGVYAAFIFGGLMIGLPFGLAELAVPGGRYGRVRWGFVLTMLGWCAFSLWMCS